MNQRLIPDPPQQDRDRLDENRHAHVTPPFRNPVPERDESAPPPPDRDD